MKNVQSTPCGIEPELIDAIENPNLNELISDVGELALDSVLTDGLLREIPVINTLVNLGGIFVSLRERIYATKVLSFLQPISKIPEKERKDFAQKLRSEEEFKKFSETVFMLIDRMENRSQATVSGAIMEAHIKGKVSYETAVRMCSMVTRAHVSDLRYLKTFIDGVQGKNDMIAEALFSAGFISNGGIDGGTVGVPDSSGTIFVLNDYGRAIRDIGALDYL